jgi:hypothetical protein
MEKYNYLTRKLYKVFPELDHSLFAGEVKSRITKLTQNSMKKNHIYKVPKPKSLKDRLDNVTSDQANVIMTVIAIVLIGSFIISLFV